MKIYKSNYRHHWVSPYTILKAVCFWEKDDSVFYNHEDKPGHKYDQWVDRLEPFCKAWEKFLNFVHPRIDYVKIDRYDTWNMDRTLADIILPMLKQLKATKHGSPMVDMEDVPEHMRTVDHENWESQQAFDFYHADGVPKTACDLHDRWAWVLDEMIFAFECKVDDSWQEAFSSGEIDHKTVACNWDADGNATMYQWEDGPNHTYTCDYEGMKVVEERIQNGFRLFGRYYEGLWD
jgi:hypothetical protein